jgi:hypothetical protein
MPIRFLGGDTGDGGSPRLYQAGDDYLVQGYAVTPQLLVELDVPDGETVVRVPASLLNYLASGGDDEDDEPAHGPALGAD